MGSRTRLAVAAAALLSPLLLALPAGAASPPCTADVSGNNCQSIADHDSPSHALQTVTGLAGSRLVAVTPSALTQRQDFAVRRAANQPFSFVIKYDPQDVLSNLCVTEVGGVRSHPVLQTCDGSTPQHWRITDPEGGQPGSNITNVVTGFALTHFPNGGIHIRKLLAGSAGGNRRDVVFP